MEKLEKQKTDLFDKGVLSEKDPLWVRVVYNNGRTDTVDIDDPAFADRLRGERGVIAVHVMTPNPEARELWRSLEPTFRELLKDSVLPEHLRVATWGPGAAPDGEFEDCCEGFGIIAIDGRACTSELEAANAVSRIAPCRKTIDVEILNEDCLTTWGLVREKIKPLLQRKLWFPGRPGTVVFSGELGRSLPFATRWLWSEEELELFERLIDKHDPDGGE